ncbi:nucleoside deaminase [Mucilaginibacter sp. 14171R-50]|uniref:nucleoside deaminase n=1 Tax=Mucilaginibacter sp. 14171R-50 TaxID=2703789 RepID=UPI00138CE354|nr:nucleoside deaminase [Mucilaginibacter sp. 14171R-50]QHS54256.1 nucleoside deaminase [Mucilaginibacter sp. 14171R-50]
MEETGNEKFMQMAIDLSEYNVRQAQGGPFGAVIVKDGMVVARSANRVIQQNDPTAHAEVSVIRLACQELGTFDLEGCEIYTSCEPCPMCLGAIYWARISKIYYANTKKDAADIGFDDHFIYNELEKPMDERKLPCVQMMHTEALAIFDQWKGLENKPDY